jgi:hypothetical protein
VRHNLYDSDGYHLPLILFYDRAISFLFAESFPHAIHVMEYIYNNYLTFTAPSAPRIAQLLNMDQEHVDLVLSQFQWTLTQKIPADTASWILLVPD